MKKLNLLNAGKVDQELNTTIHRTDLEANAPSSMIVPARLTLLWGPEHLKGQKWYLSGGELSIGRREGCSIAIDDSTVSRQHCQIQVRMDGVYVVDLSSTNRTRINHTVLLPNVPHKLTQQALIRIGNVILEYLPGKIYAGIEH